MTKSQKLVKGMHNTVDCVKTNKMSDGANMVSGKVFWCIE